MILPWDSSDPPAASVRCSSSRASTLDDGNPRGESQGSAGGPTEAGRLGDTDGHGCTRISKRVRRPSWPDAAGRPRPEDLESRMDTDALGSAREFAGLPG